MAKKTPTATAADFMTANDKSPVVSGAVIGAGGQGAVYTLASGDDFRLKAEDLRSMPARYPRWVNAA